MALKVIDVSYAQGKIDWNQVKGSIDAAILRCGYGSDQTDQDDVQWARNVSECERLGIPYGVYLYSYANNATKAESEVKHALRLLKGHRPDFPVYLDEEDTTVRGYCAKAYPVWEKEIRAAGYTPGLYSGYYFRAETMPNVPVTTWWMAWYASEAYVKSNMKRPDWQYDAWQYASDAKIPGITGRVDINWFYKDFRSSPVKVETKPNAVYRLYDEKGLDHLYTISTAERDQLIKGGWKYEGIAWYADPKGMPIYRAYLAGTGDHLLTSSKAEYDTAIKAGWKGEGVAFHAKRNGRPVYRLYHRGSKSHLYTTSDAERASLIKAGWKDEGRDFYA